jgi:transposase
VHKYFTEFLKKGTRISIETFPEGLIQIDWKEDVPVQIGRYGRCVKVHGLCFSLSFSRKMVVRISDTTSILTFINCHQEAFRRFKGLLEYIRPDF